MGCIMKDPPMLKKILIGMAALLFAAASMLPGQDRPEIFVQLGHADTVRAVAVSPDGSKVISASSDKTIKVWERESGRLIRTLTGHSYSVSCIAVSPDSRYLVSGADSRGGTVKLWDLDNGKEIATFEGHKGSIKAVAFSPGGRYVATSANGDKKTRLWDTTTKEEVRTFNNGGAYLDVVFSPNGRHILLAGGERSKLIDWKSGEDVRDFELWYVYQAEFSPDGKKMICAGPRGLNLLDVQTGKIIRKLSKGSHGIAAYSPDGRYVLSQGKYMPSERSYAVELWDTESGEVSKTYVGHSKSLASLCFSADGRQFVTGSADMTVKLWDLEKERPNRTFRGYSRRVNSILYSPNGGLLVSAGDDKTIKTWSLLRAEQENLLSGHEAQIQAIECTSDGSRVISIDENGGIILWDTLKGDKLKVVRKSLSFDSRFGQRFLGRSLSISPNDRYILESRGTGHPRLYDLVSNAEVREYTGKSHVQTFGDTVPRSTGPIFCNSSVAFSPDGRTIVGGCLEPGALRLWEVKSKEELYSVVSGLDNITDVIWSPNGRHIISSGFRAIKIWEFVEDAGFATPLRTLDTSEHRVAALALSPDGRILASAGHDKTVKLWNMEAGEQLRTLVGHTSGIRSVDISPDGRHVVSGSWDTTIKIFEVDTGKEIAMLVGFEDGEWVIVTPEGYYSASANGGRYLNVRLEDTVYSIDNYVEKFYRPDVVRAALAGVKLKEFSGLDAVKPPPRIRIESADRVRDDTALVTLVVTDTGGGIGDIRLYLNESAVVLDAARGLERNGGQKVLRQTYSIKLADGVNRISAVAFNAENTMRSDSATVEIVAHIIEKRRPSLHAIVIGINEYENPALALDYAVPDAILMAETIQKASSPLFEKVSITLLKSRHETTRDSILGAMEPYRSISPEDLFVFYVASHGLIDNDEYFLLTSDVGSTSTRKLKENAISQNTIKEIVANIPTSKKLIIIDTCSSQALGESLHLALQSRGLTEDTALKVLSRAVGVTILSATKSSQEALEGYKNHGLFTYILAEGWRGKADYNGDGYVKTFELADFVDDKVPAEAEKVFKRAQYPTVSPAGQGFPIAVVK
jgi:WD40 repeat protein